MFLKRVKRKCGIRGCRNTDCFAVSRNREVGNTVIICKDCLASALNGIDLMNDEDKTNFAQKKQSGQDIPVLFYNSIINPPAASTVESTESEADTDANQEQEPAAEVKAEAESNREEPIKPTASAAKVKAESKAKKGGIKAK